MLAGCRDFGTGGTGEWVVPRERLTIIEPSDLRNQVAPTTTTVPSTAPATQPAAEVSLSLADVRRMALTNNLDLQVELLNPTIAAESLSAEEAAFESLFTANIDYTRTDTPTASQLSGSQVDDLRIEPGIEIPLRTGGFVRLSAPLERFETNNQFSTLNPAYSSDLAVTLSQPLLRGAGTASNAARIRVAFYRYQQAEARTKLEVIRVLVNAERVYWRLHAARQELRVRKAEYDLAEAQLARARRVVDVGQQAEVEIVRAESGLADTVEAIILAENAVRDRQRELKRILNEPGLQMGGATILVPATDANPVPYRVDPERLAGQALDLRMELLETELRIAEEAANVAFARNDVLPLVLLDYTYNVNGLGEAFDDSFDMVADKDFEDHRLGLRMEVPIGNQAARARLRRALAGRLQQLATKELRQAVIRQEVYNAADQLEANWQRILAARQRAALAARVLEAEIRQFEQGLRTSTEVLDAQTRLADAQSSLVAAVAEYQIAQVDLAFATGTVLGESRVTWAPIGPK